VYLEEMRKIKIIQNDDFDSSIGYVNKSVSNIFVSYAIFSVLFSATVHAYAHFDLQLHSTANRQTWHSTVNGKHTSTVRTIDLEPTVIVEYSVECETVTRFSVPGFNKNRMRKRP
jgi:hypothetical protein